MKKTISIFMAAILIFCLTVSAFAAELNQDTQSGSAKIVYKAGQTIDDNGTEDPSDDVVSGTYTVTIPDYIVVADVGVAPNQYNVTAENVLIPFGTQLSVDVTYGDLKIDENALTYELQASQQTSATLETVTSGDTILTVAAGNPDAVTTTKIGAVLTQNPIYAGVYTDTAVFTISVK